MNGQVNTGSVLALESWLEFNRYKWGLTPLRLQLTEGNADRPAIQAVVYLDKKGRIVQPPLNPYLPVVFHPTPTAKKPRLSRQWLSLSKLLVKELSKRGVKGSVAFPPEVEDIRQWQWHGFLGEVRYTFYIDFPYEIDMADHSERKQINKAKRRGFTCEIASRDTYSEVVACLAETESRQGFNCKVSTRDLEVAFNLLGEDTFRVYVCRSNTGEIACARIVISSPGLRAVDWVAGTKTAFLPSGCTQFLIWHILNDLTQQGAVGFDFAGANLPSVSAAKADWGGKLVPFYVIRPLNLRTLGLYTFKFLKQRLRRKHE